MKTRLGLLTFHASYNCGSMLQTYAMQQYLTKKGYDIEIIDFSTQGQKELYSVFSRNSTLKLFLRNVVIFFHRKRIARNYEKYEEFKNNKFHLTQKKTHNWKDIDVSNYHALIVGSDQVWNTTIIDYDIAYFLPWNDIYKVAYAPSFGAKNPIKYSKSIDEIKQLMLDFNALSSRENNGKQWIKELTKKDVPVVLDPTLLLDETDYENIIANDISIPEKYIFYYSPTYSIEHNRFVKQIARKFGLPVIAFNAKSFYLRAMNFSGFKLPDYENPESYLRLMKNAELVITTSFHGTVFSTVFRKKFWVIKNGGMYGDDDRVATLLSELELNDRLIVPQFDDSFNYMAEVSYTDYTKRLRELREVSEKFLLSSLEKINEGTK